MHVNFGSEVFLLLQVDSPVTAVGVATHCWRGRNVNTHRRRCGWTFSCKNLTAVCCSHPSSTVSSTNKRVKPKVGKRSKNRTSSTNKGCLRMRDFIRSSFDSYEAALSPSSSSRNDVVPTTDFDLDSELAHDLALLSVDESDIASTGAPASCRSSTASFYYPPTPETAFAAESGPYKNNFASPYQSAKHQRRKSASGLREGRKSSLGGAADRGQHSHASAIHGPGVVNDAAKLSAQVSQTTGSRRLTSRDDSRRGLIPDNMSVSGIRSTTNKASVPPANRSLSAHAQGWLDVYDLMTESLSSFAPSEKANSVVDDLRCVPQTYAPALRSFSGPLPIGGGPPRSHHHSQRKPSGHLSHRPPSMHITSSVSEYNDPPRRSVSSVGSRGNHHNQVNHPQLPPPRPVNSQKDFQEAIVDIILENDVNDLVDLEEFLQGYFKLNSLYQEIVQQFFNDLTNDLVHPRISKAPGVFARLASHSSRPQTSVSKTNSKSFGKATSSKTPT
ncbi:hypothetical protein R1sor_005312 [Riccia sorocarpa]|uniref:RGS domain-containing protein n=1 Tax=Riccia sorocarpa TaxID=122646 RepID=A0ABD3HNF5_9MARC